MFTYLLYCLYFNFITKTKKQVQVQHSHNSLEYNLLTIQFRLHWFDHQGPSPNRSQVEGRTSSQPGHQQAETSQIHRQDAVRTAQELPGVEGLLRRCAQSYKEGEEGASGCHGDQDSEGSNLRSKPSATGSREAVRPGKE